MTQHRIVRILAFFLACLVSAGCTAALYSCDGGTVPDDSAPVSSEAPQQSEVSVSPSDPYKDSEGKYTLDNLGMPAFDFDKKEFRVLVYSNEIQDTYFSEEIEPDLYETTDSVLNEAVRTRNDLVEERYGVTVKAVPVRDVNTTLRESLLSGDELYDAALPFASTCAVLAQDLLLYDLTKFSDYIHLDAPWWDQNANATFSIGGKLYFTYSDLTIMHKITSGAILFNKVLYADMLEDTYGNLYDIVRNRKWTFDLLCEMTRGLNRDLDQVEGMDPGSDFFAFGSSNGDASAFYLGAGESLIGKDADDLPVIAIGSTERSIVVAQTVLEKLTEPDSIMISEDYRNWDFRGKGRNCWEYCLSAFGENRCIFRTTAFSAIKKLRNYEGTNPFGIVPFPLLSADQQEYYTPGGGSLAYGVCIPINAEDPEFSAYMLEVLSCGGKNTVVPAYYQTTLKNRDLSYDDESAEMLDDYVFKNIRYDLANVYNFGISSMLSDLMNTKSSDIVSRLDGIRSQVQSAIDTCVEIYLMDE